MALKGDFAKLTQLQTKIGHLAASGTRERLARVLGAEALAQVQLGFRESRDPYGVPWKPLALRSGKPLLDTRRLSNSFSSRIAPGGFTVGTNFVGAAVHQHGATIVPVKAKFLAFKASRRGKTIFAKRVTIPSRPMMPTRVLGPIWTRAFNETATRFLSKLMRA